MFWFITKHYHLIAHCLFWTNINMEIWLRRNKSCWRRQVNPEGRTGQDCSGEQVMVLPVPVPGWWGPRRGSSWSWRCWVREGRCGFDVPDLPSWHKLELEPEERQDYWTENTRKLILTACLLYPLLSIWTSVTSSFLALGIRMEVLIISRWLGFSFRPSVFSSAAGSMLEGSQLYSLLLLVRVQDQKSQSW